MNMTKIERDTLNQLKREGYICIARDHDGNLYAYGVHPTKKRDVGNWQVRKFDDFKKINKNLFLDITFDDPYPIEMDVLLEQELVK